MTRGMESISVTLCCDFERNHSAVTTTLYNANISKRMTKTKPLSLNRRHYDVCSTTLAKALSAAANVASMISSSCILETNPAS